MPRRSGGQSLDRTANDSVKPRASVFPLRWILLLPHPPVDALPQQIRMAAVSCVLLDTMQQDLPDGDAFSANPFPEVQVLGQEGIGVGLLAHQVSEGGIDDLLIRYGTVEIGVTAPYRLLPGSPLMTQLRQSRSTSAKCRNSPSRDIDEGGTERRASCSGLSPLHFISNVVR